ncbi:Uncharacterised protein [Mycobacteroides abscessus subsp. bolletii]|nr:Uncharacterised protein [Mycobacteroides abscessus subsp. bolletii]
MVAFGWVDDFNQIDPLVWVCGNCLQDVEVVLSESFHGVVVEQVGGVFDEPWHGLLMSRGLRKIDEVDEQVEFSGMGRGREHFDI